MIFKYLSCFTYFSVLVINVTKRRCVFSRHLHGSNQKSRSMSNAHRIDILRTFFVTSVKDLVPEFRSNESEETGKHIVLVTCIPISCFECCYLVETCKVLNEAKLLKTN